MKKNLLFAASILTIGGFLAACGTTETTDDNTATAPDEAAEEVVEEETAEDVPAEEAAEEEAVEEEPAGETAEETESETGEATEETDSGDEESADAPAEETADAVEPEGTLTQSDEQAYELYVLPGFELTSEEPGKDSLYMTEDSSVFMRIETFTPEDLDFAYAEDVMKQTLQASNPDAEPADKGALEGEEFINSSVFEVPSAEGTLTGAVFEKEGIIVRLTIFDSTAANATSDFIKMGQTVQTVQ